jgi:LDH2 family malate/lactate/ureidoglycolate dehydrogenase
MIRVSLRFGESALRGLAEPVLARAEAAPAEPALAADNPIDADHRRVHTYGPARLLSYSAQVGSGEVTGGMVP